MAELDGQAVSCAVPTEARNLVRPDRFDYADAFVVGLPPGTRLTAEEWARVMFTPHGPVNRALAGVWNAVMGLDPPPNGAGTGPFELVPVGRHAAILAGEGPRYRVRLVVLTSGGRLALVTFAAGRRIAWRELLRLILLGHRRVAPVLLERAVAATAERRRVTHG